MARLWFGLLSIVVLAVSLHPLAASAYSTYAVGTCKPNLPSYTTISAALAATPAPTNSNSYYNVGTIRSAGSCSKSR